MTSGFSCRVLRPEALTEADRSTWSALSRAANRSGGAFLTWQYATAVASVMPSARVAALEDGAGRKAFLAFQAKPGVLGALGVCERIGGAISDYAGLVAEPGFAIDPGTLLARCGIGAFEFSHLDESQAAYGLAGEAPRVGLRIDLPEGGGGYLADLRQRKKSVVRETDRRLRRLAEKVGPARLEIDLRDRPDLLDTLFAAKLAQYARTGKDEGAVLAEPWAQGLIRTLYAQNDPDCRGQLSALYAGDTWVALHVGLRAGDLLHYWFPVYNHELASFGPGRLLLQLTIEGAASSGIACIDRGEGDNPTKREYATSEHLFYRGLWMRAGVAGTVAGTAQRIKWKIDARRSAATKPAPEPAASGEAGA